MSSEDLTIVEADLVVRRPPEIVLEEARKAARALKDVIETKPRKVMFNGEQYLEFEDWQTVGRFYGITVKATETEFVTFGQVKGFSAKADALRADGQVISSAEAMCLDDEDKWRTRPKYEWRNGANGREKVKIGDEPVPLFQLKSMAQTRACAKALRNVLAWVVVLAGYRPTPAEELQHETDGGGSKPSTEGTSQSAPAATTTGTVAAGENPTTYVKSVSTRDGVTKKAGKPDKPWKRYDIVFEDGRSANTFSKGDGEHALNAQKSHALVRPRIEQSGDYFNLMEFLPLEQKKDEPATQQPDEPVDGPEDVLVVREVQTDAGKRWVIQTTKRQLVTDVFSWQKACVDARTLKVGIVPEFEQVKSPDGTKTVNRLTKLVIEGTAIVAETPSEPAAQQEEPPATEPATPAEPAKCDKPRRKRTQE